MMTATQQSLFDLLVQQIRYTEETLNNFTPSDMVSEVPMFNGSTFEPFYVNESHGPSEYKDRNYGKLKVVSFKYGDFIFDEVDGNDSGIGCGGWSLIISLPENESNINEIKVLQDLQERINSQIDNRVDSCVEKIKNIYLDDLYDEFEPKQDLKKTIKIKQLELKRIQDELESLNNELNIHNGK